MTRKAGPYTSAFRPKIPKPKPKGKKKTPKFKASKVNAFDVFKSVLDSDAGGESSRQSAYSVLKSYLSLLSGPQLKRIDRKIKRLHKELLKESKEKEKVQEAYGHFRDFLERHYEEAIQYQFTLYEEIAKKLKSLKVEKCIRTSKGKISFLIAQGKRYSTNTFILHFFEQELEKTREMIRTGKLIKEHEQHSARWFIAKAIEKALKPR